MVQEFHKGNFTISTDRRKLDLKVIHNFLTCAYWSKGIKIERVKKAVRGSLCFGVYYKKKQIGFARVITDYVSFGYLADVFIVESYRKRGLSKWLLKCIINNAGLKNIKAWMLATRDAHGLYSQFGFKPLEEPQKYMRKVNPKFLPVN